MHIQWSDDVVEGDSNTANINGDMKSQQMAKSMNTII